MSAPAPLTTTNVEDPAAVFQGLSPTQFLHYLKSLDPKDVQALFAGAPAAAHTPATVAPAAPAAAAAAATEIIDIDAVNAGLDAVDPDADAPLAVEPDKDLPGPPPAPKLANTGSAPSIQLIRILTGTLNNPSATMPAGAHDTTLLGLKVSAMLIANRTERGKLALDKSRAWIDYHTATGRALYPRHIVEDHLAFVDQCVHPNFRQLNGLFDGDVPIDEILAAIEDVANEPPAPPTRRPHGRPRKAQASKFDDKADDDDNDDDDEQPKSKKSKANTKGKRKATNDNDDDGNDDEGEVKNAKNKSKNKARAKAT